MAEVSIGATEALDLSPLTMHQLVAEPSATSCSRAVEVADLRKSSHEFHVAP
jgi:hypothetical protein